ncbi:hypothetical protein XTPLMG728_0425 [Xanthomonas translucens pv. poae]|uniref:Uncharacterized protein n=1 Tax=Xanthomonas graminis pv. poae TaxID=227946 RepID=A0A0K2ZGH8_9XANT|nr:hypothetical protein XTPLMG728_0425 [Xanthomonas translucens pv. poae]
MTDATLFRKHAINRHSLVFFISLTYAIPTFYAKAMPLQRNAGFVAGAAVAQGGMMFGLRLGQDLMDAMRRRFNSAFNRRHDLPEGFKEAIEGIVGNLRAGLDKLNGFVGDFQQDRRITPHMDRQLTFFKQDMSRIVTGLEQLVATGTGQESPVAANPSPSLEQLVATGTGQESQVAASLSHRPAPPWMRCARSWTPRSQRIPN